MSEIEDKFLNYDLLSEEAAEELENKAEEQDLDIGERFRDALEASLRDGGSTKAKEYRRQFKQLSGERDADVKMTVKSVFDRRFSRRFNKFVVGFFVVLGLLILREWVERQL